MIFNVTFRRPKSIRCGGSWRLSGFTLVEVLVALAVMGIVLAGLAQIGGVSSRSSKSLALTMDDLWRSEGLAVAYVNDLREGRNSAPPAGITSLVRQSSLLNDVEKSALGAKGWELGRIEVFSATSGRPVWQGEMLLPAGTLEGGALSP